MRVTSFQGQIVAQGGFKDVIESDHKVSLPDSSRLHETKQGNTFEEENPMVMYNEFVSSLENRRCKKFTLPFWWSFNKCQVPNLAILPKNKMSVKDQQNTH